MKIMKVLLAAALVAGATAHGHAAYKFVAKFSDADDKNFMFIDAYNGSYNLNLDLDALLQNNSAAEAAGVGLKCAASDLKYHIHMAWNPDNDQTFGFGADCAGSTGFATGGHYDPTSKCGGASGATCPDGKGDNANPPYDCSTENKAGCEVGDTSGKFGKATATSNIFNVDADLSYEKTKGFKTDFSADYANMSVVFHCGSKTNASTIKVCSDAQYTTEDDCTNNSGTWDFADLDRAFCAKLSMDTGFTLPAGTRTAKNVVAKFSDADDKNFLYIDQATGTYTLNLDYNELATQQTWIDAGVGAKCAAEGLKYHIHGWPASGLDGPQLTAACGKSNTGGHYDPGFACGPATGAACDFEKVCRDSTGAEDSNCNYTAEDACIAADGTNGSKCAWGLYKYDAKTYAEVGDLSGKAGKANAKTDEKFTDADLGMAGNWGQGYDFEGMSIVFHCGDKTNANQLDDSNLDRAFCAELKVDADFVLPSKEPGSDIIPDKESSAAGLALGAAAALAAFAL